MRKKIWLIFCMLIIWVRSYSTTIYFSTSGNDATGTGIISKPFASLGKATSVSVPGDIVYGFAGVYHQTTQVIIPLGVSLQGEGNSASGTHIFIIYNISGLGPNAFYQGSINMNSTVEGTNGNQTINDIWFDGDNFTSFQGISVRCRSNVVFNRCKFTNFQVCAVNFNGKFGRNTGTPPAVFSTGNQLLNSVVLDCNDRVIQTANSVSCGSITYEGQSNLLFQYDTLINTSKAQSHNGDLFGAVQGNNKWVSWLNNILTKPADDGAGFNFGIESWYDMGHSEYAFNTYTGGGNAIDIGYGGANKDTSSYSWYIHDNNFLNTSLLTSNNAVQPVLSIAIQFESTTNTPLRPINATIGDVVIQNNYCKNIGTFVQIAMNNFAGDFFRHAQIDHNVLENMGYANNTYAGIFQFTINLGTLVDSIFITNNTVLSNTGAGCSKGIVILQPNVGVMSHIYFVNNVAINVVSGYGYFVFRGNTACDNIFLQNNITFNNAFTNNPFTFGGTPAQTNLTNTGNILLNPQFISLTDFHLQSTSPGVNGGLSPPAIYIGAYPPGTIVPTITWANPAAITYGTPLSSTQLNATSGGVPGTFAYSLAIGTFLNASPIPQTLTVIFTPTDQSTYSVVTKSVTILVNKATASMSFLNLTLPYTGTQLSPLVVTNPVGLTGVDITFNGIASPPINSNSYPVVAGLSNQNYTAPTITATFTITPASAIINVTNTVQQYDSTLKNVTINTIPAGLHTTITGAPQRYKGTYAVHVALNEQNYTATAIDTTLTITPGQTTVAWTPANLTYPTLTGNPQTNATSPKTGVFTYIPPSGTLLNAGSVVPLQLNFVPSDTNIAPILAVTRNIVVSKGTTSIVTSDTVQFADGTPKFITAIAGQSGTVSVSYTGAHTVPGDYPFTATFSSANWTAPSKSGTLHILSNSAAIFITNYTDRVYTGSQINVTVNSLYPYSLTYDGSAIPPINVNAAIEVIATITDGIHIGADTVVMNIIKADPPYTWPVIAPINNPTPLSATQLNITSSIPISVVYNPISGTVLGSGTHTIAGRITPTDVVNYNIIDVTNTIVVNAGGAVINVSNTSGTYNGLPHPITATTIPTNLDSLDIVYGVSHTPPTNAGSYPFTVQLINPNVTATPVSGTLIISQATYTLTWVQPLPIQQNSALTSAILNPSSSIAGTFTFNYPLNTSMNTAGSFLLTATFHPTDNVNYGIQTISVPISVFGNPFLNFFIIHGNTNYLNLPGQIPDLKP